jgi:hypothetical protein
MEVIKNQMIELHSELDQKKVENAIQYNNITKLES